MYSGAMLLSNTKYLIFLIKLTEIVACRRVQRNVIFKTVAIL